MKHIDRFFKIPVRIYEGAMEMIPGAAIEAQIGVKRLRVYDIIGWQDMAFRELDTSQEFPCTLVNTETHDFLCHWPRKKFEAEYEAYCEKYEEFMEGKDLQL